jgi:hypothetical protein
MSDTKTVWLKAEVPEELNNERFVKYFQKILDIYFQGSVTDATKEVQRLREAMSDLMDFQNGPPLAKYEKGWNKAMKDCEADLDIKS